MIQEIDFYFPFLVLFYGAFMTLVTQSDFLREKALESMDTELLQWFYGHRLLGQVCLFVGGLWVLQRMVI